MLVTSTVNYLCLGIFCLVKNNVASCAYYCSFFFFVFWVRVGQNPRKNICAINKQTNNVTGAKKKQGKKKTQIYGKKHMLTN